MADVSDNFNQLPLPPLTPENLDDDVTIFPIPSDVLQLQVDVLNVEQGRVNINTFPPDYQQKIKNYYRFSATRQNSRSENIAKRTNDTLDVI